jgi:hypothetical protein
VRLVPTNNFQQTDPAILSPYTHAHVVTPSDTEDLDEVPRALYASKGASSHCSVSAILSGDTDPITLELARGEIVPVRVKRVRVTNTDATNIVALY